VLAGAVAWHEDDGEYDARRAFVMATHDVGLALAARSFGLEVVGA
jgi:hypothetical protein